MAEYISARFSPPRRARSSSTSASSPRPSRCNDTARANNCDVAGCVATPVSAAPFAQRFWLLMLHSYCGSIGSPLRNLIAQPSQKVIFVYNMDRPDTRRFAPVSEESDAARREPRVGPGIGEHPVHGHRKVVAFEDHKQLV